MKIRTFVLGAVAVLLVSPLVFATPARAETTYTFNLVSLVSSIGPNVAMAANGDTITVYGSGVFDTTAATVTAGGSFVHKTASGALVARGSWFATTFGSFVSFGSGHFFQPVRPPGLRGGHLEIRVILQPTGGAATPELTMVVVCLLGSPPPGAEEGVTVGQFSKIVSGATLMHLA